jgi:hypothetical protein
MSGLLPLSEQSTPPSIDGRRLSHVSAAQGWSIFARQLLDGAGSYLILLGWVAAHQVVRDASHLVSGNGPALPADPIAARTCPIGGNELHELERRLRRVRNAILHLHDRGDDEHEIRLLLADPGLPLEISVTTGWGLVERRDSVLGSEVFDMFDRLAPWLASERQRLEEVERHNPRTTARRLARQRRDRRQITHGASESPSSD